MPVFMVDITFSDNALNPGDHAVRNALRAAYPDASIENWDAPTGKHFWRALSTESAPSFVECLAVVAERVKVARAQLGLHEDESLGVQIALRDARYDVYETIPTSWPVKKNGAEKRKGRSPSRHAGGGTLSVAAFALTLGEVPLPV